VVIIHVHVVIIHVHMVIIHLHVDVYPGVDFGSMLWARGKNLVMTYGPQNRGLIFAMDSAEFGYTLLAMAQIWFSAVSHGAKS
jgi:hypothetical protein